MSRVANTLENQLSPSEKLGSMVWSIIVRIITWVARAQGREKPLFSA
jgi:hypothetical protein